MDTEEIKELVKSRAWSEDNARVREGLNNSPVLGDNSAPRLGR